MKQVYWRALGVLHVAVLACSAVGEEREIVFSNEGIQLHASLVLPEGVENPPAVVLIHGSGQSDRSNPWTRTYAEALMKRGIASLHPDKRGCGRSGGDWRTATLTDLAKDAMAGVVALH